MHTFKLRFLVIALITFSALLTACGSSVPVIKPFKMDIQQGNVVTSKMLLQLRPGMTKSQVKFVMGSPLIIDSFHTNRWDYFYQLRQAGKVVEQRRVILDFEKELLSRVRGDVVPQGSNSDAVGLSNETEFNGSRAPSKRVEKEGVFENLKFWNRDETPLNNSIEKPAAKPAAKKPNSEDKGLLDSLKFWKKEAKPDVKKPLAPAKSENINLKELEKPELSNIKNQLESVIIDKPVEITPVISPETESATKPVITNDNKQIQLELPPARIGPLKETTPGISFTDAQPASPAIVEPKAVEMLLENEKLKLKPENSENILDQDKRKIFRFDKKLNTVPTSNKVEPIEPLKPAERAVPQLNTTPVKAQTSNAETPKAEVIKPDMFDRILEKIGF